jgi:hypothetical protein
MILMRGAISPLPQYVFVVGCLVKHRDNFTFFFVFTFFHVFSTLTYLCLEGKVEFLEQPEVILRKVRGTELVFHFSNGFLGQEVPCEL